MSYIIVENKELQQLVEEVNEWLTKGFVPSGGVSYSDGLYIQGMYTLKNITVKDKVVAKPTISMEDIVVVKYEIKSYHYTDLYRVIYANKGIHCEIEIESSQSNITNLKLYLQEEIVKKLNSNN